MNATNAGKFFYGDGGDAGGPLAPLSTRPAPVHESMDRIYLPSEALIRAVNVALLLGMPLLLTGEPGVGKTRLAYDLAARHRAPFESYAVTSESSARDLLYGFDELRRMRDAFATRSDTPLRPTVPFPHGDANAAARANLEYVTFRALGRAILRAGGDAAPVKDLSTGSLLSRARRLRCSPTCSTLSSTAGAWTSIARGRNRNESTGDSPRWC